MFNFRDLISGATDELTPNKKKTTPSDDFVQGILGNNSGTGLGGWGSSDIGGADSKGTTVTKGNPLMGALGGLSKGFQNDSSAPMMMQPVAIDPGMQVQLAPQTPYNMRGLANGGEVQDGETVTVGEDGKELVHKTADGKVYVLPNPQTLVAAQQSTATPEQLGITQTVRGDDNIQNIPNDPGASMGMGQPDNYQYAGRGTADGQTVTPTQSTGGKMVPNPADLMGGQPGATGASTPTMSPHQQQYADALQQMAIAGQVHPNKFKDAAFGALQGFNNAINRINQPIQDYSQMKAQRRMAVIEPQLQAAQAGVAMDAAQRKAAQEAALTASEVEKNKGMGEYYSGRDAATLGRAAQLQKGSANKAIFGAKIFDPKTPQGQAMMQAAGWTPEQIAAAVPHDYTNPRIQKEGPDTFEYDKILGAWKPSGLPTDKAKELHPYAVTEDGPDGNEHQIGDNYYLTDEQASRLSQQKALQGQRLKATADLQTARTGAANDRATAARTFKLEDAANHDIKTARQSLGAIAVAAPKHTSHDDIVAKQHAYWMALDPKVQAQIPEPK